jgi:hypothetical protein
MGAQLNAWMTRLKKPARQVTPPKILPVQKIAPQLRLQYFDQPIVEFLVIGMEPIKTWKGEPVILTVAKGGAGLILIGQDGRDDAEVSVSSRFIFVRSNRPASTEAALARP